MGRPRSLASSHCSGQIPIGAVRHHHHLHATATLGPAYRKRKRRKPTNERDEVVEMTLQDHYLKRELYQLVRNDLRIFEFLQEGSLDGLWYWDMERPNEEWLSPRLKALFGYADDEVPNTSIWWQENIHPDDLPLVLENLKKHKTDPNHPYDQVVRYRHKNGSLIWVRCRGIAIRDEKGKPIRMLGAHTDLTNLMRAEAELKDKADLLQLLNRMAATANEALLLDSELNVKLFVPETKNLLGLTPADIGQSFGDLANNVKDPELLEDVQKVVGTSSRVEKKLAMDDARTYIRRIVPLTAPDNKLDGVVIILVDITQHARDEEAVRNSERRLTYATKATDAAIWDYDLVTGTVWWSDEYKKLFGEPGQSAWHWWVDRIHPDDREQVLHSISECLESSDERWTAEYRYRRADGSFAEVMTKAQLTRDESGQAVTITGATQDITERKQSEQRLNRAERLASIGTMATGLVHEIANPLAALQIAAQAALNMRDNRDTDRKMERSLRNVVDSATRCDKIVKDLWRFVGGKNTERRSRDLNEIIVRAADSTRAFCDSHNASIEWIERKNLPPILMNGLEVELLLVNLIHNAAQACETRGIVTIFAEPTSDSVRLTVRDNGSGISEEAMGRAFEPFYTTREKEGGMGLGLSIAYGIVADHGGSIRIDGKPGQGTTVQVELPTIVRGVA